MRRVAHCDQCGKEWLAEEFPKQCSKCKSRKWNSAAAADDEGGHRGDGQAAEVSKKSEKLGDGGLRPDAPKAVGKPGAVPPCPKCESNKGVVDWGPLMWHCNPCSANFPRGEQ